MSGTTGNSSLPVDSAEKSVTRFNAENCLTQHAAILRAWQPARAASQRASPTRRSFD
jgi:hypothetical protein